MTKRPAFLIIICTMLVLWASTATAQSRFFRADKSGYGLGVGLGSGDNYSSFGASVSLTAKARYDFGLAYSWLNLDDAVIGKNGNASEVTPFASLTLLRPTETSIIGTEVTASYSFGIATGDALERVDWAKSEDALSVGANFYLRFQESEGLTIYPGLSVDYLMRDLDGGSSTAEDDLVIGGDLSFLFNQKTYLSTSYRGIDGNDTWGLSLGLVIPGS